MMKMLQRAAESISGEKNKLVFYINNYNLIVAVLKVAVNDLLARLRPTVLL